MSIEHNKEVTRRFSAEVWGEGNAVWPTNCSRPIWSSTRRSRHPCPVWPVTSRSWRCSAPLSPI